MFNGHITIVPSNIEDAKDIMTAHIQSLAFPIESWLEDGLYESKIFRFLCENRCIGYGAIQDDTLTFFYVETKYLKLAPSLLEQMVHDYKLSRIRVMTQDAALCALMAEWSYDTQKQGCIFSDTGLVEREDQLCAEFVAAVPKDIPDIRHLAGDFFDPPSGGFETLEQRVIAGTIFLLKQKDVLLGCGIVERLRLCPQFVSIGMIVGREHRKKGAARAILIRLKEWTRSHGLTPVAGCWYYNTLSRKSLESAGMAVTSIVYDAILKEKDKLPLRTGNPPGELVLEEEKMSNIEEKLAESLTAQKSIDLIPYLPYLLQDLWELGAKPSDIVDMIKTHIPASAATRIIDLGCGKGAVSVRVAQEFGCHVKGVDLMPEFISYAKQKACEYGMSDLCDFETGDINRSVTVESGYDIVIFGAIGSVLGDPLETLRKLQQVLKPGGYIIIDDAYTEQPDENYQTRAQWLSVFDEAGLSLIAEKGSDADEMKLTNSFNQSCIEKRAAELKQKHPALTGMLDDYVKSQQEECDELESRLKGVTWLLRREN